MLQNNFPNTTWMHVFEVSNYVSRWRWFYPIFKTILIKYIFGCFSIKQNYYFFEVCMYNIFIYVNCLEWFFPCNNYVYEKYLIGKSIIYKFTLVWVGIFSKQRLQASSVPQMEMVPFLRRFNNRCIAINLIRYKLQIVSM